MADGDDAENDNADETKSTRKIQVRFIKFMQVFICYLCVCLPYNPHKGRNNSCLTSPVRDDFPCNPFSFVVASKWSRRDVKQELPGEGEAEVGRAGKQHQVIERERAGCVAGKRWI